MKYSTLFQKLFPQECLHCKTQLESSIADMTYQLCKNCYNQISLIDAHCLYCDLKLNDQNFICPACQKQKLRPIKQLIMAFNYQSPPIKSLMTHLKFNRRASVAICIASLLNDKIGHSLSILNIHALQPIPSDRFHYAWRGFNPTEQICAHLCKTNLFMTENLLKKRLFHYPQQALSRSERLANLSNAFQINPSIHIPDSIILFDDVFTTGTTLFTAAEILKRKGVKDIYALVVSKA